MRDGWARPGRSGAAAAIGRILRAAREEIDLRIVELANPDLTETCAALLVKRGCRR